jgi:hypothetical protein
MNGTWENQIESGTEGLEYSNVCVILTFSHIAQAQGYSESLSQTVSRYSLENQFSISENSSNQCQFLKAYVLLERDKTGSQYLTDPGFDETILLK